MKVDRKNEDCRKWMANILKQCTMLLRVYGLKPDQVKGLLDGFLWALEGYEAKDVGDAFHLYLKSHEAMPTPSNIIRIIEDKGGIRMNQTVYIELKRKSREGYYMSREERAACEQFENESVKHHEPILDQFRNDRLMPVSNKVGEIAIQNTPQLGQDAQRVVEMVVSASRVAE
jgi:hypothetical protein